VSSDQLEKEFVSSFILGDVMNCVYIVKVEAIHRPPRLHVTVCVTVTIGSKITE
jgi:hypothetical protein